MKEADYHGNNFVSTIDLTMSNLFLSSTTVKCLKKRKKQE